MIKLTEIVRRGGRVFLIFEYSHNEEVRKVKVPKDVFDEKMIAFKRIIGRKPKMAEIVEIVKTFFKELREKEEKIDDFDWEKLLGIDLEA